MALSTGVAAAGPGRVGALGLSVVDAMPSQRRLRMPLRRHDTGWPDGDPNPLGTLRQFRTAVFRLLPRLIRRPGATDPYDEYVANAAFTGMATGGTHPPGREDRDAGGPVARPARSEANTRATAAEARTRAGRHALACAV